MSQPLVPTLDLGLQASDRQAFAQALGQGIRSTGFIGLTGHGIDPAIFSNAYAASRAFFALPEAEKRSTWDPALGGQRGWTPPNIEKAKDAAVPDLKEFFHVGRDFSDPSARPPLMAANLWPDAAVPEFRPAMQALFTALESIGQRVMQGLALWFGLPEDHFKPMLDRGDSILRPLHYPPIQDLDTPAVRAGAHEDIDTITLLIGSEEPGLEILTRSGQWVPVTTIPGTILCNVGDMLQRHSNGILPSTTHRVINPPGEGRLKPRYSIPFFYHYNDDVLLSPLPGTGSHRPPEPAVTAYEFLLERLEEIGLYTPAQRIEKLAEARRLGVI